MVNGFINKQTTEGLELRSFINELINKNEIHRAKRLCQSELQKNNADAQLLFFLSKIAVKQSDIDTAIQLLLTAQKNEPMNAEVQLELAKLLYSSRSSYPEAAKAALNILNQGNFGEQTQAAKIFLSKILTDSAYFEEAVNHLKAALMINPENVEAYIQWAKILMKEGKNAEAFNKLELILSKDVNLAEVFYLLSQVVSFADPDGIYLQKMKEVLQQKKLSRKEKGLLNLALAKAYKDQKDYRRAYQAYTEAATQINKDLNYDVNLDLKLFKNIRNTFNQKVFSDFNEKFNQERTSDFKPVFVINFPGLNTQPLLKDLLKENKGVYLGENSFLSQMLAGSRYSDDFLTIITKFVELSSENLDIFRFHYQDSVLKTVGNVVSPIDTSKMNFMYVGLIKLLFPQATIIYLKTATREQAMLEAYMQLFEESEMNFSYNLKNLNQFYKEYQSLMQHWLSLFPDIQVQDAHASDASTADLLPFFIKDLNTFC